MSKLIICATVSVGVFAFVVIYLANPAYATNSPSITPKGQIVQELKEKRCVRIETFIDTRISTYNENKDRHILNHQRILEKIQNLTNSLKSKGVDVTKLTNDYNTLNTMTKTFAFEYSGFIGILNDAKLLGCGDSEGGFKTKMEDARGALKIARDQAQEIWKYINTVIRADLNDLRTLASKTTDNN